MPLPYVSAVQNLSPEVDQEALYEHFKVYGEIFLCKVRHLSKIRRLQYQGRCLLREHGQQQFAKWGAAEAAAKWAAVNCSE